MKKELEIEINSINLGLKKEENPEDDRIQYLEIDEFDISFGNEKIFIIPKKHHIKEYKPSYCVECLKEGKRNKNFAIGGSKGYWCKKHYIEKTKKENPENICPKCGNGVMEFGTCDYYCNNCDYREPHVHNVEHTSLYNFVIPVTDTRNHYSTPTTSTTFLCTCTSWETPEQHKARRAAMKKE